MTKFRYVFNTNVLYQGKYYGPGDTIDLTQEEAAANPGPWLRLGTVEALGKVTKATDQTMIDVDRARRAIIAGSGGSDNTTGPVIGGSAIEKAIGALKCSEVAHFFEGATATPVDPISAAFSENVEKRVAEMRLSGRRESEHILFGEAMKELRSKVASSSW